jgi:hypothetical protein
MASRETPTRDQLADFFLFEDTFLARLDRGLFVGLEVADRVI